MRKIILAAALLVAAYASAHAGHQHCHTDQYATTCYSD
jgi:hypothetical protein